MNATPCLEGLESRDFFSASMGEVFLTPEPAARDGQIVYVGYYIGGGALGTVVPPADAFATEPNTAEAKEQFTRYKPHVILTPRS
jgi:hypothetical protein